MKLGQPAFPKGKGLPIRAAAAQATMAYANSGEGSVLPSGLGR